MKSILPFILFILFNSLSLSSQDKWCGSNSKELHNHLKSNPSELISLKNQIREFSSSNIGLKNRNKRIIPVVVHVIHDGGKGNISYNQIQDALDVINRDFSAQNSNIENVDPDFSGYIADLNIEFKLAKVDPEGNCTDGIVRVNNPELSNNGNDAIKYSNLGGSDQWDPSRYFNFWVVNSIDLGGSGTVIGYAKFPIPSQTRKETFGLVMRADNMGTIEEASFSDGTVLTHEIGHCFGLFHTFETSRGDGCRQGDCNFNGDFVCDTPPTTNSSGSCANTNSCSEIPVNDAYGFDVKDMKENFMSYSDGCLSIFTKDQKEIMDFYLGSYDGLKTLYKVENLNYTGVETNGFACKADFNIDKFSKCVGEPFVLSDKSFSNITSWTWDFGVDATPKTSSDQNPSVSFSSSGSKTITLTVSDGVSEVSTQKNIFVNSVASGSILESFNSEKSSYDFYIYNESANKGWSISESEGRVDNNSLFINNYINSDNNISIYELSSVDLSDMESSKFSFFVSYSLKTFTDEDYLKIFYSKDCGSSWDKIITYNGFDMFIKTLEDQPFFPSSSSEWKQFILDIPEDYLTDGFGVKFEHSGGDGNNLFIDDVLIAKSTDPSLISEDEALSVNDQIMDITDILLFPNPSNSQTTLSFEMISSGKAIIVLKDVLGRNILNIENKDLIMGNHSYNINLSDLNSGIYFVDIQVNGARQIERLIVE